ncbi:MAG TPA: anthranilate synthase component I family protein [Candidatus Saccharimonadales bacterium]|nr:anthranilate synthase component I family protein [Candidatus Saccharimonadales bacterium]
MKKRKVSLRTGFVEFLSRLGPDAKNISLLAGSEDGWRQRIAWNPCDSYVLEPLETPEDNFFDFISYHSSKRHLIVGFINYNLGHLLHGIKTKAKDSLELPNMTVCAYDNYLEKNGNEVFAFYQDARFIDHVKDLDKTEMRVNTSLHMPKFKVKWDRHEYHKAFEKVRSYIYNGVVYQLNLTHRLDAEFEGNSRDLFRALSERDAGKMSAYVEAPGFELISMSPERFIRTDKSLLETAPIKGTRRRGKNAAEDADNYRKLLSDEKEKAELNMITDLLRNDLGKVCTPGSVTVKKQREVEKMKGVMHTFSLVQGSLKKGVSPIEALLSMFPGGSITGCPKKKAIEIIDELEYTARDAYCGNIFVVDERGDVDSSILIRTVTRKGNRLTLPVGGGIVYDSDEQKEYQESLDKADALIRN